MWKRFTLTKRATVKAFFQSDRALLIFFFFCAFFLRILNLGRDILTDESYYYYMSRFPSQYIVLHLDTMPMLYFLYHLFTADIPTFRLLNVIIGSLIPCLIYMILRTYDVRERYRILGASLPVFFVVFVKYSSVVFLDTLCTFFFLIGVYFYRKERWRLTDLFFSLSILTKQVAMLGVVVFIGYLLIRRRSIRPIFPIIILSVSAVFIILIPLGGWKPLWYGGPHGDFSFLSLLLFFSITPALLPLLVLLLYRKYYVEFVFFIIFPLFFFIYQGNTEWYAVLPLSFNIVSAMVMLNEIHSFQLNFHFKKIYATYFLLIFLGLNIAFSSYYQALATYQFINDKPHQLRDVTQFISEKYNGRRIVMIDVFWSFYLYPFETLKVDHRTNTVFNYTVQYYSSLINETDLVVMGTIYQMNHEIRKSLLQLYVNNIVFKNDEYTVIDLAPPNHSMFLSIHKSQK